MVGIVGHDVTYGGHPLHIVYNIIHNRLVLVNCINN